MKVFNLKSLKLSILILVMVAITVGCKKKGPFDYFEETDPIVKDKPQVPVDDSKQTKEPGNNIGDVGQVVFKYRGDTAIYKTVRLGDGSIWLQQNLGSQAVATASDDFKAYGDLFQSGRWDDGHQVIVRTGNANGAPPAGSSAIVNVLPVPNDPTGILTGAPVFFTSTGGQWWNVAGATITAAKPEEVTATNGCDPCKAIGEGWRLPTRQEWEAIRLNEGLILGQVGISSSTPITTASAFVSILKLPAAGVRAHNGNGALAQVGNWGLYWSSTTGAVGTAGNEPVQTFNLSINTGNVTAGFRSNGFSVRCLKK